MTQVDFMTVEAQEHGPTEISASVLLAGENWDAIAPSLTALAVSDGMDFIELGQDSLQQAIVEDSPSLLMVSSDFDSKKIERLKAGTPKGMILPRILLCVTLEDMESDDLYKDVDDFLVLPCSTAELDKRMKRLISLSKPPGTRSSQIRLGALALDVDKYRLLVNGDSVKLAWMEFQLLKYLMQNAGRIFTREQLLTKVWGNDQYGQTRTVDVHVRRLRFKLGSEGSQYIRTVTNVGYGFMEPV